MSISMIARVRKLAENLPPAALKNYEANVLGGDTIAGLISRYAEASQKMDSLEESQDRIAKVSLGTCLFVTLFVWLFTENPIVSSIVAGIIATAGCVWFFSKRRQWSAIEAEAESAWSSLRDFEEDVDALDLPRPDQFQVRDYRLAAMIQKLVYLAKNILVIEGNLRRSRPLVSCSDSELADMVGYPAKARRAFSDIWRSFTLFYGPYDESHFFDLAKSELESAERPR